MKHKALTLAASAVAGAALLYSNLPQPAEVEPAAAVSQVPAPAPAHAPTVDGDADQAPALSRGVDVSTYDRGFDWSQKHLAFGIAKATEGTGRRDPTFTDNWTRMGRNDGLVRGAYHYGHPENDPVREADHFLSTVTSAGLGAGDLLMLDLETTDGRSRSQVNQWAKRWLQRVQQKTGVKPFFYSSWYFAQDHGDGLGGYPLWVAHYGKDPGRLKAPEPWKQWAIHQYAATDHDHNVSRLTAAQLRQLGYQPPAR